VGQGFGYRLQDPSPEEVEGNPLGREHHVLSHVSALVFVSPAQTENAPLTPLWASVIPHQLTVFCCLQLCKPRELTGKDTRVAESRVATKMVSAGYLLPRGRPGAHGFSMMWRHVTSGCGVPSTVHTPAAVLPVCRKGPNGWGASTA
jgi:hypothetical protein